MRQLKRKVMICKNSCGKAFLRSIFILAIFVILFFMMVLLTNRTKAKYNTVKIRQIDQSGILPKDRFEGILRIATFNIAHGRGTARSNWNNKVERTERLDKIASFLKAKSIDIVVLNEVDFDSIWSGHSNQAEIIARKAGFIYFVEQRNYDLALPFFRLRFGNSLLSKFPIKDSKLVEFSTYSQWEPIVFGAKKGLISDIAITEDLIIRVFSTHLDDRSEYTRVRCANTIIDYAHKSPFPFLLIGDLNSSPSYFPGAETNESGMSAMDIILHSKFFSTLPKEMPSQNQMTFSSMMPSQVIDWILVPKDWEILYYEVPSVMLSDHLPVIMHVRPRLIK